jgi:serine-type D-Ala-D-Ala carboxypeptidase
MIASLLALTLLTGDPVRGIPITSPWLVGMSADRLAKISHVIEQGISVGAYPGASVLVGRKGFAVLETGFGHLTWGRSAAAVIPDRTIYDLASLTKVIATTTAIMVLYDQGKVGLDDPVSKFIPTFTGGAKNRVTVRMLLEHRSGLPPGRNLYRNAHSPQQAREQVISTPLSCAPGCYQYSDLGADMLGFIVEAAAHQPLDQFLAANVYGPLGMFDTSFRPADSLDARIAPTKTSHGEPAPGLVHDGNAFALGSVAGHAGLFSTVTDLGIFAQMMLNGGEYNGVRVLADSTVRLFTARAAKTRALGWDTCDQEGSCGEYLSERAYGHTGYTGTSIWIDPDREMFVVLLTNRVYEPRVRRPAKVIADVRADLADASALALEDFGGGPLSMPTTFRADLEADWNRPLRRSAAAASKAATPKASLKPAGGASAKSTSEGIKPAATKVASASAPASR